MRTLFKGAQVYRQGAFSLSDLSVRKGKVEAVEPVISPRPGDRVIDVSNCIIIPGLVDVHVHLREPGFVYKETIETGTRAAARGGYTTVCAMPNLSPAPDTMKNLKVQLDIIKKTAKIPVIPYGCITMGQKGRGELADFGALAPYVCGFSDDGRGVQDEELMELAMLAVKKTGKPIVAHCEDETLLRGGYIHDGPYARLHGHAGICSESETAQVKRDLKLAAQTGCPYHVCHVSAKETVAAIREAKKAGVNVTCETGPHYLLLTDMDLQEDGRFKMNPPIRETADRDALIEGILDGTIDMIVTDHAPHSEDEKAKGLEGSLMGVVGLECAFRVMYDRLVRDQKVLSLEKLVELMCLNPRKRFGIEGGTEPGQRADIAVIDPNKTGVIDPDEFYSMGRATPFEGWETTGDVVMTMAGGSVVWEAKN
ncbi:MAG: dihydroorotase [Clostridia bacterium]|jgi:dihydroorotase|nr:dihydroorotase [Clostridia bacterium]